MSQVIPIVLFCSMLGIPVFAILGNWIHDHTDTTPKPVYALSFLCALVVAIRGMWVLARLLS